MSELMVKALSDDTQLEEVVRWLRTNDTAVLKDGISQIEFARFLLEFLRKHTRSLLPTHDQKSNDSTFENSPLTPDKSRSLLSTSNDNSKTFSSSFTRSSTPIRSKCSTPVHSRQSTPFQSRNSTPFNSPGNNSSLCSNSSTTNCSPNSMKLLEKRLTSREPKSLQLSDFLVTKEKQSKQKKKKRIALISCANQKTISKEAEPVSSPDTSISKQSCNNSLNRSFSDDRSRETVFKAENSISTAKEDSENVMKQKSVEGLSPKLPSQHLSSMKQKHAQLIRSLALLYSASIASNLMQDLLKELNYVISLLMADTKTKNSYNHPCHCDQISTEEMLTPIAKELCLFTINLEGIYFALIVLEDQWKLLKYLNVSTLNTLSQNTSLISLLPEFARKIRNYINDVKTDISNVNILNREMLSQTVKFQMDTDCRPNYVSDELFYAFKKQRDEFYSLLQEWEDNSQRRSSTEFFKSRHKRLRQIFTINTASTNMFRLANLFVSQIMASVFNENVENCDKLCLSGIPMTKFDLLNRRFVTPCSIVVGNEKRFPGIQEFFKDFLRSSSENSFFLSHVRDALVQRIVKLNNFKFSCEVSVALERQELFLVCINKLCLLAKFLSLITFLPYQDKHNLPLHLRIPLADVRKQVLPPLDLDHYLISSLNSGRAVITIPWIVEFLNGMDSTSVLLPCYKVLLAKLQYFLYRIKLPSKDPFLDEIFLLYSEDVRKFIEDGDMVDERTHKLRRNTISLRQLKCKSEQTQNDFSKRFVEECFQTINCSQILITLYVNSLFNNVPGTTIIKFSDIDSIKECPILVSSEFYIGETALYQCCPQLYEIKSLLEGGQKLSYKSVTPITEKTFCERRVEKAAIEVLMETHFFENIPKTVKKCVDFVAEVNASYCVKSICQTLIPKLKTRIGEELRKCNSDMNDEIMVPVLSTFYSTLKYGVKEELSKFRENIENSLKALIEAEIQDESVVNICVDITCRKCIEIVYNWVFNYINVNDTVQKEQEAIIEEANRSTSSNVRNGDDKKTKKSKSCNKKHDFDEWVLNNTNDKVGLQSSPVKVLHTLRHLMRRTMGLMEYNGEGKVDREEIIIALNKTIECIECQSDLQFIAFRRIMMISLDLAIILVFRNPDSIDDAVLEKFKKLWSYRKVCKLHLTFEQVLSPRNMQFFWDLYPSNRSRISEALTKFLIFTINNELLHVSRLYSQILILLRTSWPSELLKEISDCLGNVLKKCNTGHDKINFAMGWIADFIRDEFEFS